MQDAFRHIFGTFIVNRDHFEYMLSSHFGPTLPIKITQAMVDYELFVPLTKYLQRRPNVCTMIYNFF